MKADILNRIFGLILGTLVVNIVAIVGAMFAVAKLVAHCVLARLAQAVEARAHVNRAAYAV